MSYLDLRNLSEIATSDEFTDALSGAQVAFATAEVVRGVNQERPTTEQGRLMLEFMRAAEHFAGCAQKVRKYLPQ